VTCLQLSFRRLAAELRLRQDGQALIEYALIISLIALVAIVALRTTGTNIKGLLNTIAGEV
jgi:Flp pilus assembly pilin Flp